MQQLHTYFDGERHAGMLAAAIGVTSIGFAVWLFRGASPFRAMWIPLALIGLLQLAIGVGLNVRTGPQVAALVSGLERDPAATRAEEIARMEKVSANFKVIKVVEVVLLAAGVALSMAMKGKPAVVGVAMALVAQSAVMLAFDVFAEARGDAYLAWLRSTA